MLAPLAASLFRYSACPLLVTLERCLFSRPLRRCGWVATLPPSASCERIAALPPSAPSEHAALKHWFQSALPPQLSGESRWKVLVLRSMTDPVSRWMTGFKINIPAAAFKITLHPSPTGPLGRADNRSRGDLIESGGRGSHGQVRTFVVLFGLEQMPHPT
jgi:hypothetical protein